jgi:hypothetical protein
MGKGIVVAVTAVVAVVVLVDNFYQRHRCRKVSRELQEMESAADYFYDKLYTPTEEELSKAQDRVSELEDAMARSYGYEV